MTTQNPTKVSAIPKAERNTTDFLKHHVWVGEQAELHFQLACIKRRWEITKPLLACYPYDFVIRRPGHEWEAVQVKGSYVEQTRSGFPRVAVNLRRGMQGRRQRYAQHDFDLLAAVDLPTERIWLIPFACLRYQRSNFTLRAAAPFLLTEQEPDLSDIEALTEASQRILVARPNRKLSPAEVLQLRTDYMDGASQRTLRDRYQVSQSSIGRILRGESYARDTTVDGIPGALQQRHNTPPNRKLTMAQATDIRQKHAAGQSKGSLARAYGIERTTVRMLLRGTTYRQPLEE